MTIRNASMAVRRFGLGARRGDLSRIGNNPREFLVEGLGIDRPTTVGGMQLKSTNQLLAEDQAQTRSLREARRSRSSGSNAKADTDNLDLMELRGRRQRARWRIFQSELDARLAQAINTDAAFIERWVMFWSDHLCVSAARGPNRSIVGAYEREAIRPHVLGRFADLLVTSARHPAMIIYLDNQNSIGPNSPVGKRSRGRRGLNENLAREILELHTLGVDGGYTQSDVTNFSRILTGWGVAGLGLLPEANPGTFRYYANRHEPGSWTVLGKSYQDMGEATGEAVLRDLAKHPSTARHIARKIAAHFVSDPPPEALVKALELSFRETEGDLKEVARTLLQSDSAWQPPPRKILPPYDFFVAVGRAFGPDTIPIRSTLRAMQSLGQPLWQPPSPKGWPLADNVWGGPSAIVERLRIAEQIASGLANSTDPRSSASDLFGEALSAETTDTIALAETRQQGLAILMMSPEFQRR